MGKQQGAPQAKKKKTETIERKKGRIILTIAINRDDLPDSNPITNNTNKKGYAGFFPLPYFLLAFSDFLIILYTVL